MTTWTRCAPSLAAALALALAAVPARAGKMKPEADARFTAGSKAFEAKEYDAAIEEFLLGYLVDPKADFLYAMGQVYRAQGRCEKAKAAYDAFKRSHPGKKKAAKADANLARCQEAPAVAEKLPEPPPATPPSATPATPTASEPAPAEKPPALGSAPATIVVSQVRGPWYTDWLGDSLAVGGFVALGVGAFLWTGGRSDLEEANTPGRYSDYASFTRDVESASRKQTIGVVTFAAGGALMAGAVLRWWLRPGVEPPVEARASRDGGMVFYTERF